MMEPWLTELREERKELRRLLEQYFECDYLLRMEDNEELRKNIKGNQKACRAKLLKLEHLPEEVEGLLNLDGAPEGMHLGDMSVYRATHVRNAMRVLMMLESG